MATRAQWVAAGVVAGVAALGITAAVLLAPEVNQVTVGSQAPGFRATTLTAGDTVSLDRYKGQIVLLNVWATWCQPCEAEIPSMQKLHEALGPKGLKIVAVSIDKDPPDEVQAWIAKRHVTFQVLQDQTGKIQQIYQTTGVPESFILDKNGVIVKKVIGAIEWTEPGTEALLSRLLDQRAATDR
jgi:peroxiredoxin